MVFRFSKDLYLIMMQKLTLQISLRISPEIHSKPYKIRCFNKNSSVWGVQGGAMTQDFMKSWFIAPLLHLSNWIVLVETFAFIRFWVDFTWNPADFMKSAGFHVKSKDHLHGIVTLCLLQLFCWNKRLLIGQIACYTSFNFSFNNGC